MPPVRRAKEGVMACHGYAATPTGPLFLHFAEVSGIIEITVRSYGMLGYRCQESHIKFCVRARTLEVAFCSGMASLKRVEVVRTPHK